jgi:hypothetical protein
LLAVLLLLLLVVLVVLVGAGSTASRCINKRLQLLVCDACRSSKPHMQVHTPLGSSILAAISVAALLPSRTAAAAAAASCLTASSSCPCCCQASHGSGTWPCEAPEV